MLRLANFSGATCVERRDSGSVRDGDRGAIVTVERRASSGALGLDSRPGRRTMYLPTTTPPYARNLHRKDAKDEKDCPTTTIGTAKSRAR